MLSGPRLDPFSARLLAIHQKAKRAPSSTGAVDDVLAEIANEPVEHTAAEPNQAAQSPLGPTVVHLEVEEHNSLGGDPALAEAMRAHCQAQETVDTGCAECGGKDERASDPVAELRREVTEIKARLEALEQGLEELDREVAPGFR